MAAEKRTDWFFIDALCIDQNNELEKSSQVQQMGEMYRCAEEVVTWIVDEDQIQDDKSEFGSDDKNKTYAAATAAAKISTRFHAQKLQIGFCKTVTGHGYG
jgi:hypothetical protein